jgi:hypothetical protein
MPYSGSLVFAHHARKLYASFVVLAIAGFLVVVFGSNPVANLGALIVLIYLLWIGYAVTCPRCRLRLIFHAMSTQPVGSWFHWLLKETQCPRCRYPQP